MTRNYKEIVNQLIQTYNDSIAKAPEALRIVETHSLLKGLNGLLFAAFSSKDFDTSVEIISLIANLEQGGHIEPYNLEAA
ncbi:DUF4754 family protein [Escherichia coli]|nr:DUF4754 family protein [Escherichia coli]